LAVRFFALSKADEHMVDYADDCNGEDAGDVDAENAVVVDAVELFGDVGEAESSKVEMNI
jgi:hypothetical protein